MTQSTCEPTPLYARFGDDPGLCEVFQRPIGEMPDRIATLNEQVDASEWKALRRTAHQLRGAARSRGFDAITSVAARLERALCECEPEAQIREAAEALVAICERARTGTPA